MMKKYSAGGVRLAVLALVAAWMMQLAACGGGGGGDSGSAATYSASDGKAGSQARFAIVDNFLYTINGPNLQIFDVTTASNPLPWSRQYIGFDIETLFGYNQHLFIGSRTGVFIYDNTDPRYPKKVSQLLHARSCDPVVVEGNYAYVTLRNNNSRCGGTNNQLDIIDLTDIANPELVNSYLMQAPAGLGVDTGRVFVCDGIAGLKVLNVSNPTQITVSDHVPGQNCYDLIPDNGNLVVSGYSGIYQYAYATLPMTERSVLAPGP